jgi:hypothetical protein
VVEATLYALPIQVITGACSGVLALEETDKLPYERLFKAELPKDRDTLLDIAETLAIESPEQFGEDLPRRVARAMIAGGLDETVRVIRTHRRSFSRASEAFLVKLAKTLWVYPEAAERLSRIVERPPEERAAALNAAWIDVGDHYLRRAGHLRKGGADGWTMDRVRAINKDGESEDELKKEIRRVLAEKLGCAPDDGAISEEIKAWKDGPIVVVIANATKPSEDLLKDLLETFKGIVIVLLTGQPSPAGLPAAVDVIAPPIEPGQERELVKEHDRVDRKLADNQGGLPV